MLTSLSIRNVVLIDKLDLTFEKGLGVFTGETGAGKSILLDSLSLILGARADSSLVRYGENQLSVTAEFCDIPHSIIEILDEQGIEIDDDTLIIRRIVTKEGKSKSFINDQSVGVSFLKAIGENLVEIHGQFSTHSLLNPNTHLSVLDSFGKLQNDVQNVKNLWHNYKEAHRKTEETTLKVSKANEQKEYLSQSLIDLENINPQKGEEETLTQKRTILMNSEKILASTNIAFQLLTDETKGVTHQLNQASKQLEKASHYDETAFQEIIESLYQSQELVIEATSKLEQLTDNWSDTAELPSIDDRLFTLRALARKHQTDIDSLPDLIIQLRQELNDIEQADFLLEQLKNEEDLLYQDYLKQAQLLSQKRQKIALELDKCIAKELPALKLEKAEFKTSITKTNIPTDTGLDTVEFLISTNKGTPLSSLHKIASGGELSRFMLALKVNLAKETSLTTLIFDEIDSGVGGATADAIGLRLNKLSQECQVLSVTHAPQVAAYGKQHFTVSKAEKDGKVVTSVTKLTPKMRLTEIARMLSGSKITKTAESMAQELLEKQQTL